MEEVAVHAGQEVLVEFDDNAGLIVGILGQQLRPLPINQLSIIILIIL
jgi:hypothetical protein